MQTKTYCFYFERKRTYPTMNIKKYFTGKSGLIFWGNLLLAVGLVVGIPYAVFLSLGACTHHGEKIEVPDVTLKPRANAIEMLEKADLEPVISDSTYDKQYAPGTILSQFPKAGNEVKSGRQIYLTVNMSGYPPVEMPDLARNSTERLATIRLKQLGFTLTPTKYIEGETAGYVIYIKQGGHTVSAGEKVHKEKPLTLYVGVAPVDTLEVDEDIYRPITPRNDEGDNNGDDDGPSEEGEEHSGNNATIGDDEGTFDIDY